MTKARIVRLCFALLMLAMVSEIRGDTPSNTALECPVCDLRFTHPRVGSYSVVDGSDFDLCWHSASFNIRAH